MLLQLLVYFKDAFVIGPKLRQNNLTIDLKFYDLPPYKYQKLQDKFPNFHVHHKKKYLKVSRGYILTDFFLP